jgi:hypothetical protein
MPQSPESDRTTPIPLTGIYLDLPTQTVVFAANGGVLAAVRLTPKGIVFQLGESHPAHTVESAASVSLLSENLVPGGDPDREKHCSRFRAN